MEYTEKLEKAKEKLKSKLESMEKGLKIFYEKMDEADKIKKGMPNALNEYNKVKTQLNLIETLLE